MRKQYCLEWDDMFNMMEKKSTNSRIDCELNENGDAVFTLHIAQNEESFLLKVIKIGKNKSTEHIFMRILYDTLFCCFFFRQNMDRKKRILECLA